MSRTQVFNPHLSPVQSEISELIAENELWLLVAGTSRELDVTIGSYVPFIRDPSVYFPFSSNQILLAYRQRFQDNYTSLRFRKHFHYN